MARNGWFCSGHAVRVYFDNGEPTCVATCLASEERAQQHAETMVGRKLDLDTWFIFDDSPHLALVTENTQGLGWGKPGDANAWTLAGVNS